MGLLCHTGPKYSKLLTTDLSDTESQRSDYEIQQELKAFSFSDTDQLTGGQKYSLVRQVAVAVSWVSVVFSFLTGVAAIVLGQILSSESLFGYGLDAVLDSLSSVAVLWRLYSKSEAAETKERKACFVISLFFLASAVSLSVKSIKALVDGTREEVGKDEHIISDTFAAVCGVIALALGVIKVICGKKLNSRSLVTDSVITFVGSFMSVCSVISLEVFEHDHDVWYLDASAGIGFAIFLLVYGIKLLVQMTCLYHTKTIVHLSNRTKQIEMCEDQT